MKTMRLLLMVALAAPLSAQQPDSSKQPGGMMGPGMMGPGMMQGGMPGGMGMMMGAMPGHMMQMMGAMGPMMRSMAFNPAHLLGHQEDLQLTKEQVTRLTVLRDRYTAAQDSALAAMQTHMKEMGPLMSAPVPDTAKIKPHFDAMQAGMSRAHWAMVSVSSQTRALLTETQRARVDGWADANQQMMMGMMGRGKQ